MVTLSPTQVAELKAKIAAKYFVDESRKGWWAVHKNEDWAPLNDNDHDDPLDAEAEMEAIIQDEVKAAME